MEGARQRREESILKKKALAQQAAEKKLYFDLHHPNTTDITGEESAIAEIVKVTITANPNPNNIQPKPSEK